jgi:hypothetical protein
MILINTLYECETSCLSLDEEREIDVLGNKDIATIYATVDGVWISENIY